VQEPRARIAGWRVERELARGGMGIVYLAQHPRLPRVDALKVLHDGLSDDPVLRQRFLHEAERAAELGGHPNIVVIHDRGEDDGLLYIAMQYVPGGDLRTLMRQGPLGIDQSMNVAVQLASALDAAHAAGVVHRDVKPENVLAWDGRLDRPLHVVLSDFGISHAASRASNLTVTGSAIYTPKYASPEQLRGEGADGRSDQYGLACMLYEMLTRQAPMVRESVTATITAHLYDPVPSISRHDLPPELNAIFERGMAKSPAERYSTCLDFVADVSAVAIPAGDETRVKTRRPSGAETNVGSSQSSDVRPGAVVGAETQEPTLLRIRQTRESTPESVSEGGDSSALADAGIVLQDAGSSATLDDVRASDEDEGVRAAVTMKRGSPIPLSADDANLPPSGRGRKWALASGRRKIAVLVALVLVGACIAVVLGLSHRSSENADVTKSIPPSPQPSGSPSQPSESPSPPPRQLALSKAAEGSLRISVPTYQIVSITEGTSGPAYPTVLSRVSILNIGGEQDLGSAQYDLLLLTNKKLAGEVDKYRASPPQEFDLTSPRMHVYGYELASDSINFGGKTTNFSLVGGQLKHGETLASTDPSVNSAVYTLPTVPGISDPTAAQLGILGLAWWDEEHGFIGFSPALAWGPESHDRTVGTG
jgi:serine/threonine protein kinase